MPNQERSFTADGKTYVLRFTQNAVYRIEKEIGHPLDLRTAGEIDFQTMMWGALEGARLKHNSRRAPYTIEETGDIIDAMRAEGLNPYAIVADAWSASRAIAPPSDGINSVPTGDGSGDGINFVRATSKNPTQD